MKVYSGTTVPVSRSQESIRQMLIRFGARGVQFSEDFATGQVNIKFGREFEGNIRSVSVTLAIPKPAEHPRGRPPAGDRQEHERQRTYRALHDWLKAQFVAVEFGLLSFEDVFLSHFEWVLPDGKVTTVGAMFNERFTNPQLPSGQDDVFEGESRTL